MNWPNSHASRNPLRLARRARWRTRLLRGYILFESILALTVFAIAVTSLANSLSVGIETAGHLDRSNDVRIGIRSFLEEVRRKQLSDMTTTYTDARLGVTYSSTTEELQLKDKNGTELNDLYRLKIVVTDNVTNQPLDENAEVYVYEPNGQGMSQQQAATAADGTAVSTNGTTSTGAAAAAASGTSSSSTSGSSSSSSSTGH